MRKLKENENLEFTLGTSFKIIFVRNYREDNRMSLRIKIYNEIYKEKEWELPHSFGYDIDSKGNVISTHRNNYRAVIKDIFDFIKKSFNRDFCEKDIRIPLPSFITND